mmetsp:Transcript_3426/g.5829  ORF Transcript_3426/g.5829 Transcript_3426/m.5829 type:complete len:88 (+) Transcript_3426:535-798(+)
MDIVKCSSKPIEQEVWETNDRSKNHSYEPQVTWYDPTELSKNQPMLVSRSTTTKVAIISFMSAYLASRVESCEKYSGSGGGIKHTIS